MMKRILGFLLAACFALTCMGGALAEQTEPVAYTYNPGDITSAMFENLRFYRSDHPSFGTLFLASDGMLELLRTVPRLLERPEQDRALLDMENVLEDDCSAAWLLHVPEL